MAVVGGGQHLPFADGERGVGVHVAVRGPEMDAVAELAQVAAMPTVVPGRAETGDQGAVVRLVIRPHEEVYGPRIRVANRQAVDIVLPGAGAVAGHGVE